MTNPEMVVTRAESLPQEEKTEIKKETTKPMMPLLRIDRSRGWGMCAFMCVSRERERDRGGKLERTMVAQNLHARAL